MMNKSFINKWCFRVSAINNRIPKGGSFICDPVLTRGSNVVARAF